MPGTERVAAPPDGGAFVPRTTVMEPADLQRAAWRMAHEILERNRGTGGLVVIGLQKGGVWVAERLAGIVAEVAGEPVPCGTLDVTLYRDDIGLRPVLAEAATEIPVDLEGRTVVLVDDVLYTGRTVRAALNALADHGRARAVQLAVVVDRGHRELPIRPDYVGKNLPTRRHELVHVNEGGVVIGDMAP